MIIEELYASEINAKIEWFWDGGFDISIGDKLNGWKAQHNVHTWAEAEEWLAETACAYYPNSQFAKDRA